MSNPSRGRPSLYVDTTNHAIKRKPTPPSERMTTQSEARFQAWAGAALPSLHRSNARAGNGRKKSDPDLEASSSHKGNTQACQKQPSLRNKASAFSFVSAEDLNCSERSLVNGHDPRSFASRMLTATRARDSRPLSAVHEDLSVLGGTPNPMQPGNTRVREMMPRLEQRDSQVRLSRYTGDLIGLEGMPEELMPLPVQRTAQRSSSGRKQASFHEDLAEA